MDWDPVTHYQEVAIAERYDRERFSSISGRVFNSLEKSVIRAAFRDVPKTARILDLPCGTGRLASALLESGFSVEGVDISAAMLDVAKRKLHSFGDRFTTRVADVHELAKAEPKRYDAALCARVLMHFPLDEQIAFLKSVAQLTKGTVVLTQSLSSPYQRFRRSVKKLIGNQPPANYPLTEDDLASLLRGAGLREVRRLRLAALISEAMVVITEHA
ncbi:MAG TPA: class I SAM-dependent methyltransferase [Accumulibacter sp.]|uniref:class I SAM-dependent methyltransferase n=1 Tax=Accumulibacter sp. TaxID=2053492 RepID=UPI0025D5BAFB|nr:class I SAM-dependent methyltransferase [Accumulibacter sp.]MCM8600492.1 class I SAM-dependent methyltransferase [Accumulibacter sp.]MCM8662530.1 class I SAM-dependent methyltransferase [Accumulibacter sp.]HNC51666.1 class I SAM-dependent methyltransferase [Accumulibacter sp.]